MRLRAVCLSSPACLLHAVGLRKKNFFHPHQRPLNTDTSAQRDPAPALRIAEHISRGTCVSECLSQRTKNHTKGHTDWNYIRYGRKKIRAWWIPRVLLLHKTKNATKMIFFSEWKYFHDSLNTMDRTGLQMKEMLSQWRRRWARDQQPFTPREYQIKWFPSIWHVRKTILSGCAYSSVTKIFDNTNSLSRARRNR